jgi:NAD(P)-dependent dehydrogenase (short-subunit alcohol dehydrogenase family)
LEETVAVHIVSPFILSVLLLPLIEKAKGRIIHNSSAGAYSQ